MKIENLLPYLSHQEQLGKSSADIESHIESCALCAEELLLLKLIEASSINEEQSLTALERNQIMSRLSIKPIRLLTKSTKSFFLGAAAAAVLIFAVFVLKTQRNITDSYALAQFQVLESIGTIHINNTIIKKNSLHNLTLQKGDVIFTGKGAFLKLELNNQLKIFIHPDTKIKIKEFNTKNHSLTLFQEQGSAIHSLKKDSLEYSVETPAVTIAIVGTRFLLKNDTNNTSVLLERGHIVATTVKNLKEINIYAGDKLITNRDSGIVSQQKISKSEIGQLTQMANSIDANIEITRLAQRNMVSKRNHSSKQNRIIRKIRKTEEKGITLADLKKRGRLSVITTKDGHRITGLFKARGEEMIIMTTRGRIVVKSANVDKVSPYNN